jgi:ribosomal protein S18 acetylase RimI-like enzyme
MPIHNRSELEATLAELIDEQIILSHDDDVEYTDWENVRQLRSAELLATLYVERHELTVTLDSGELAGDEIARMEWVVDRESGIAYIHWLRVADQYQHQGIGSTIRAAIMETLHQRPGVSHVLSEAYTEAGKQLMSDQDFRPLSDFDGLPDIDDIREWFAKTV